MRTLPTPGPPDYDRLAAVYDRRWARYIRATTRATWPPGPAPGRQLLDLGCGTGALLRELVLESARAAALRCRSVARHARLRPGESSSGGPLALGDVGALPYPSARSTSSSRSAPFTRDRQARKSAPSR